MNAEKTPIHQQSPDVSGYISVYDIQTDTQLLMFTSFGSNPYELKFRTQHLKRLAPAESYTLILKGDFSPFFRNGRIDKIGEREVSLPMSVNNISFFAHFWPEPDKRGNFLLQTSNGLRGTGIVIHNSPVGCLVVAAIVAVTTVVVIGVVSNAVVEVKSGDSEASVEVGREDGGGNGEGEGGSGGSGESGEGS
jgi:hypothetical protein